MYKLSTFLLQLRKDSLQMTTVKISCFKSISFYDNPSLVHTEDQYKVKWD